MRFSSKGWAMVAGLVVVALVSQAAMAQGQGRRGRGGPGGGGPGGGMFGPPTAGRLLGAKEVQDALKLTDEQKTKIEKINDEQRKAMREAFQDGGGDRDKMVEIAKDTSNKINEVLDAGQQKRLVGIMIQVNGAAAVADPAVAKELNITEDQKKKLQEVRQGVRSELEKLRDDSSSREDREKKVKEIQEDVNKKIMAELTSDQQAQLESLKGEKVDIDMTQLRGPGGPGGGRGGERGQGRRGRGGSSESKSGDSSN
jgi:Spy/CpxP family protein refolding chaperone